MTKATICSIQGLSWLLPCTILAGLFVSSFSASIENSEVFNVVGLNRYNDNKGSIAKEDLQHNSAELSKKIKRSIYDYEEFLNNYNLNANTPWKKRLSESIAYNPHLKLRRNYYNPEEDALFDSHKIKRFGEMTPYGFHGNTFSNGFGDFSTMKKKKFGAMDANGFHSDMFTSGFGDFDTMKKRNTKFDSLDFYKDIISNNNDGESYGQPILSRTKREANKPKKIAGELLVDKLSNENENIHNTRKIGEEPQKRRQDIHSDMFSKEFGDIYTVKRSEKQKRRPDMTSKGFHGDMFSSGFGDFYTMKRSELQKRRPDMTSKGFHGDMFANGFGDFYTMKRSELQKRGPDMTSNGFHGDMFSNGFGDFTTMKRSELQKRRPDMTSKGFHGDMFSSGFGDFSTMKRSELQKRRPDMTSNGFHGDMFSNGFGDFYTMKRSEVEKRMPDMTSNGFHSNMFSNGFGDFYTMKRNQQQKRMPEMTSRGFHGNTFSDGYGDFNTMKKRFQNYNHLIQPQSIERDVQHIIETTNPQQIRDLKLEVLNELNKEKIR